MELCNQINHMVTKFVTKSQGLTFTANPSIIIMTTVGGDLENGTARTLEKFGVGRATQYTVHEDWSSPLTKVSIIICISGYGMGKFVYVICEIVYLP